MGAYLTAWRIMMTTLYTVTMVAMEQRALTERTKIQTLWNVPSGSQQWLVEVVELVLVSPSTDIIRPLTSHHGGESSKEISPPS